MDGRNLNIFMKLHWREMNGLSRLSYRYKRTRYEHPVREKRQVASRTVKRSRDKTRNTIGQSRCHN